MPDFSDGPRFAIIGTYAVIALGIVLQVGLLTLIFYCNGQFDGTMH